MPQKLLEPQARTVSRRLPRQSLAYTAYVEIGAKHARRLPGWDSWPQPSRKAGRQIYPSAHL